LGNGRRVVGMLFGFFRLFIIWGREVLHSQ
jgi:hypothetical protein